MRVETLVTLLILLVAMPLVAWPLRGLLTWARLESFLLTALAVGAVMGLIIGAVTAFHRVAEKLRGPRPTDPAADRPE